MSYILTLFVNGENASSARAVANLKSLRVKLGENVRVEMIDILENPEAAIDYRIVATPVLIRTNFFPRSQMVGDLSKIDKILAWLGLDPGANL